LQGIHPLFFRKAKALKEFLQTEASTHPSPLFIDLEREDNMDLVALLDQLENRGFSVLMAIGQPPPSELNPNHWIQLHPLDHAQILGFLENEVSNFPFDHTDQILALCGGSPQELELVLQAMVAENILQWTNQGWNWMPREDRDLSHLLEAHEKRW